MQLFFDWFIKNYQEIIGAATGVIYVLLSVKQNIWLWPVGIITSVFQLIVFYEKRIYADMSLQAYYVVISAYGWYIWKFGKRKNEIKRPVIKMKLYNWLIFIFVSIIIFFLIRFILIRYTNSDVPNIDAFTTALGVTGTYILARKYIENWYVWLLVNIISSGLYIYKGLYLYSALYAFLAIMSEIGFLKWKKDLKKI